jgi:hypothetical protein
VEHVVDSIAAVDQDDVITDHDVAVAPRWRSESYVQIMRHGPNAMAHFGRKNKAFSNVRFPRRMPVPAFVLSESVVMIPVPIASLFAIVVVEPIVIVTIHVVVIPVVMILSSHQR